MQAVFEQANDLSLFSCLFFTQEAIMGMTIPTSNDWRKLKKAAGIESQPFWKKADANVGPAIDKVDAARAKWKQKKDKETALSYILALEKLDKAFDKFLAKKDVASSDVKQDLAKQIAGWKDEVKDKLKKLQVLLPKLAKDWNDDGMKIIDSILNK
jgi:hypothetical protein